MLHIHSSILKTFLLVKMPLRSFEFRQAKRNCKKNKNKNKNSCDGRLMDNITIKTCLMCFRSLSKEEEEEEES